MIAFPNAWESHSDQIRQVDNVSTSNHKVIAAEHKVVGVRLLPLPLLARGKVMTPPRQPAESRVAEDQPSLSRIAAGTALCPLLFAFVAEFAITHRIKHFERLTKECVLIRENSQQHLPRNARLSALKKPLRCTRNENFATLFCLDLPLP